MTTEGRIPGLTRRPTTVDETIRQMVKQIDADIDPKRLSLRRKALIKKQYERYLSARAGVGQEEQQ